MSSNESQQLTKRLLTPLSSCSLAQVYTCPCPTPGRATMNASPRRIALPFALIVAILAVSTASILIRLAQESAPSLTIAALRLLFASLALTPVAVSRYRADLIALPAKGALLAALSGLFLAIHFGSWISSLAYTTVASSVVLVSTGPIWVALLSALFLRERLSTAAVVGLILAVLGGAIIASADACSWNGRLICPNLENILGGRAAWGNLLALIGAWAVSGYLIIGRRLRPEMALVPYIFVVYGFAAVALLLAEAAAGESPFGLPVVAYVWIVLLALVPQLIGHSTYNWALGFLPATVVAATTLGEPIGSAILAYFVLHEIPGPPVLVGGGLILVGIYLASKQSMQGTALVN
jgi:drug/metabolite transporter (DMT)-like permease